jgi:hypothetical protein
MGYNDGKKVSPLLMVHTLINIFNFCVSVIRYFHGPHWYRFIRLSQRLKDPLLLFFRRVFLHKSILLDQIIKSFSFVIFSILLVMLTRRLNLTSEIQSFTNLLNSGRQLTRNRAASIIFNLIRRFRFLAEKLLMFFFGWFKICG